MNLVPPGFARNLSVLSVSLLGAFSAEPIVPFGFGVVGGSVGVGLASAFEAAFGAASTLATALAFAGTGTGKPVGRLGLSGSSSVNNLSAPVKCRSLSKG